MKRKRERAEVFRVELLEHEFSFTSATRNCSERRAFLSVILTLIFQANITALQISSN
jgi:hypothetical protein